MAPRSRYLGIQRQIGTSGYRGPSGAGMREAQRTSQMLVGALNDMSNYFFKKAGTQAEIAGAEYGAKNPITEEQLRASIAGGEDLGKSLGDQDTIFGRATRKAQLSIVESELELSAKKQMSTVMYNATLNNLDPAEVADDLDSITNEYAKLSSGLSPILGQRIFASLNTASSGKYSTYNQSYATKAFAEIKAKKLAIVSHNLNSVSDEVSSLITSVTDKEDLNVKLVAYEQVVKNKILKDLSGVGAKSTTFKANFKTVEDNILQAKNNFIINNAVRSDNELALVKAINNNNYKRINPKVTKVLKSMKPENILKLKAELRNEAVKQNIDIETDNKNRILENVNSIFNANTKFHDFLATGNKDKAQEQINIIKKYDITKAEDLQEKLAKGKSTRTESVSSTLITLNQKKDAGTLTYADLSTATPLLTTEDVIKFNSAIVANEDNELKSSLISLTGLLNTEFPGFTAKTMETIIKNDGYSKPRAIYQRIKGKLEKLKREAVRGGVEVDLVSEMEDMVGDVSTEITTKLNEQSLNTAKKQVARLKTKLSKKFEELNNIGETDFTKVLNFLDANPDLKKVRDNQNIYNIIKKHQERN
tara:strand:- start:822 stop:2597 length:1776 start_codon:yes stop_codon:yes gene_type:complete